MLASNMNSSTMEFVSLTTKRWVYSRTRPNHSEAYTDALSTSIWNELFRTQGVQKGFCRMLLFFLIPTWVLWSGGQWGRGFHCQCGNGPLMMTASTPWRYRATQITQFLLNTASLDIRQLWSTKWMHVRMHVFWFWRQLNPPPPIALECTIQHLVKLFIHSAFSTPNSKSLPFLYPLSLEDFG